MHCTAQIDSICFLQIKQILLRCPCSQIILSTRNPIGGQRYPLTSQSLYLLAMCFQHPQDNRCAAGMRFKPNADCKENGPVANTCKHILQCSFVTIGLDVEQDHNMSWIVKLQAHQLSSQSSNRTTSRTSTSWAAKPWGMMQWNILKTSENHRFSGFWVICQGSLDMLLMCDFHRFSWHFGDEWLLKYLLSDLMVNLEVCGSSDVTRSTRSSWAKWLIIWIDLAWFLES